MYQQEWKDIPTWEGVFQVSNYGRVYNTITKNYLKGKKTKDGYCLVVLQYKRRRKQYYIHRLVTSVWNRPLARGEECHHKNQIKSCNCIFNLQIKNKSEHLREHKIGHPVSQQLRKKMSEGKKGKQAWNKGLPAWNKGKKLSQQTRKKMSETRKGKKRGTNKKKQQVTV